MSTWREQEREKARLKANKAEMRKKGILGDPKDYISDADYHAGVRQTVTKTKKDKGALTQKAREEKEKGGALAVKNYTTETIGEKNRYNKKKGTKTTEFIPL